jgi:hypothetical protein
MYIPANFSLPSSDYDAVSQSPSPGTGSDKRSDTKLAALVLVSEGG